MKEEGKMIEILSMSFKRSENGEGMVVEVKVNDRYTQTAKEIADMVLDCLDPSRFFRKLNGRKGKK